MIDRTPNCVRAVLDQPGIYLWSNSGLKVYLEVSADRRVYQLDPGTMKRDGLLSPSGWLCPADAGTFTRVPEHEQRTG